MLSLLILDCAIYCSTQQEKPLGGGKNFSKIENKTGNNHQCDLDDSHKEHKKRYVEMKLLNYFLT